MDYEQAFFRIVSIQYDVYGDFYDSPPDLRTMSPRDRIRFLIARALEMRESIKKSEVSPRECMRFIMEYHLIALLIVISLYGSIGAEVPLCERDIENADSEIREFLGAGVLPETEGSFEIALRLFEIGKQTLTFPDQVPLLLSDLK